MSEQGQDPQDVVAGLLADPRMREACDAHDLQTVLRLLRSRGVSMRRVAALTDLSPGRLHEYLKGDRRPSGFDLFERVSDGLRIPGRMLRLADRPWEHQPITDSSDPPEPTSEPDVGLWIPSRTVETVGQFTRRDLMLDRREATKVIAALLVGPRLIGQMENWLAPSDDNGAGDSRRHPSGGSITPDEIVRLEHAAEVFRNWDDQFGGGLRRKAVVGQLNEVADILRDTAHSQMSRRLFRVAALLAETAAMMSWDSGQEIKAQRYYVLALQAAKEAGDRAFGANILASMSRQLLYMGHPGDALELVRLAQEGADANTTPTVLAMLHTREAWAYASMGRLQGFRRATGKAEDALANARPDEDPHWIRYFDAAELAGVTGGRLLDLCKDDPRHAEAAREHIERAIQLRKPKSLRSFGLDQAGLAQVHIVARELEQAAQVGHQAVDTAGKTRSDRVRAQLQQLYTSTIQYRREPNMRSLSDRLRDHLAS